MPYYNPWQIYGAGFITPYAGFYLAPPPVGLVAGLGIGFAAGIAIGVFGHYGWGYHNWAPNWRGGRVMFNHNTYISHSTTVINRGRFGANNRGAFEHAGRGVPANFHPPATRATAGAARGANANRPASNRPAANTVNGPARSSGESQNRPASARPPAPRADSGDRPQVHAAAPNHAARQGRGAEHHGNARARGRR